METDFNRITNVQISDVLMETVDFKEGLEKQKREGLIGDSPYKNKRHKTKKISTPTGPANVDVEIIPIVNWMNSFDGIFTKYCCQGSVETIEENLSYASMDMEIVHKHKYYNNPYVMFNCSNLDSLYKIFKILDDFSESNKIEHIGLKYHQIKYSLSFLDGEVAYTVKWYDIVAMKDFIQFLGEKI